MSNVTGKGATEGLLHRLKNYHAHVCRQEYDGPMLLTAWDPAKGTRARMLRHFRTKRE